MRAMRESFQASGDESFVVLQTHFYKWIRDHRTHHKFTDSAADPHDANRGFFFSHVGWLMMKRHPAVIKYGKKIDMSDIEADPVICFFDK
ncbi:acyl-CoA desaturase-like [Copidosoma floridanum]|uniref:acyl-CoA desaturase-like n=1 Tax=Copidosoma floridanum TaxID=29053 RepID=UPI000C6F9AD2|nr:acyl-CoA desaturase-like [Copidosoma floridanum]